ncbi:MAG TPA: NUDIX hydrolase [Hyphomonadaceae bacterium]|jgi:ADP-ribose pyrophosphatase YjhB (NUDIX family)|nr:NUDIX hydrolase [Hyphomonadaceae bacterium]
MSAERVPISFKDEVPAGEDRLRRVCQTCGFVDYVNPRIVTGVVALQGDRILLCRRAIDPRKGFWTLPAGFLELGESVEQGAAREAQEEAGAELELEGLLAVYSIPRLGQVQIFYRARLLNEPKAGTESLEVALVRWDEIPWKELAFPSVRWALEHHQASEGQTGFAPFSNPPGTDHLTR